MTPYSYAGTEEDEFNFSHPSPQKYRQPWFIKATCAVLMVFSVAFVDNIQASKRVSSELRQAITANYAGSSNKQVDEVLSSKILSQKDFEDFLASDAYGIVVLSALKGQVLSMDTSQWTINPIKAIQQKNVVNMAMVEHYKEAYKDKLFLKLYMPFFYIRVQNENIQKHQLYQYGIGI